MLTSRTPTKTSAKLATCASPNCSLSAGHMTAVNEQFGLAHVASFALVFVGVRLVNTQPPEGVD